MLWKNICRSIDAFILKRDEIPQNDTGFVYKASTILWNNWYFPPFLLRPTCSFTTRTLVLTVHHLYTSVHYKKSKIASTNSNNIYLLTTTLSFTSDTQTGSASCTFHQGRKSPGPVDDSEFHLPSTALLGVRFELMLLWYAGRPSARFVLTSPFKSIKRHIYHNSELIVPWEISMKL